MSLLNKLKNMYIIDIETREDKNLELIFNENIKAPGNIKDPEKIKIAIEKKKAESKKSMAVDTDFSEVICVGIKEVGGESKIYTLKEMEEWFTSRIKEFEDTDSGGKFKRYDFDFVTFNGKSFDLPILIKCGIKNGLNFPYKVLMEMTRKYKTDKHYDLMEILGVKTLDTFLKIYCGTKKETLGDDFFRNASDEEIKKHCLQDLEFTEELWNKFKILFN